MSESEGESEGESERSEVKKDKSEGLALKERGQAIDLCRQFSE